MIVACFIDTDNFSLLTEANMPSGISEMLASGKSVGSVVTDLVGTNDNSIVSIETR